MFLYVICIYIRSPREIALFESGICSFGKDFYNISKLIPTKSTGDCVEFYYLWKKSSHYQQWKEFGKQTKKFHSGKEEQWKLINNIMNNNNNNNTSTGIIPNTNTNTETSNNNNNSNINTNSAHTSN